MLKYSIRSMTRVGALAVGLWASGSAAQAETITVFAASSLKAALDQIATDWQAATGDDIVLNYGGSGALAQQIIQGAGADLFVSANAEWMDAVSDAGLVDEPTRIDLLGNRLVLIGPAGAAPLDIGDGIAARLGDGRLAMGQVASVPAGIYARAALENLGLWEILADRLVETENVAAAARLVVLGEAPLGIVYGSDTIGVAGLAVLAVFPESSHPPIVYPGAALLAADDGARAFLGYLSEPEAQAVFVAHGFIGLAP